MAQTSENKPAYSLTPGEVQYLAKAHSDIPQFHNFMTLSEVSQSHDSSGELVSFGYHDGGHVRLRAVLLLGPPEHRKQSMSCVDVARGLDYLHRHSIVHGAVRGSNVLVKPDGTCFLGEFADEDIPGQETLIRYASWMAPELYDIRLYHRFSIDNYRDDYHGEYKLASDIYALGCTVIEIYTGAPPMFCVSRTIESKHTRSSHGSVDTLSHRAAGDSPRILSALQDIMHIIPHHRPHSGNAFKWLDKPTPCE
ncbi:kinase-like domain-containing protein [Flammula alnicola]|nr:kinase-like domain-containing protein [Flammula alnicola]